jgi:hypothetical protein
VEVITPTGSYGGGLGVETSASNIERDEKKLEDELERYHYISEKLDDLSR